MDTIETAPLEQNPISEEALVNESLVGVSLSEENVDDILGNDDSLVTTIPWDPDPDDDLPPDPEEEECGLDPEDPNLPPC